MGGGRREVGGGNGRGGGRRNCGRDIKYINIILKKEKQK